MFPNEQLASPPQSQQNRQQTLGAGPNLGSDDARMTDAGPSNSAPGREPRDLQDEQQEEPGWSWKNKQAQEEYRRAMDLVLDRDFSLQEYGDPFDEEVPNGQPTR